MKQTCWNCKGKGTIAIHDGRTVTPNKKCPPCDGTGKIK